MRPVQYFSDDYLKQCRAMTPEQIVIFLDDFRRIHARSEPRSKSRLISIKIPQDLLRAFRRKAELNGSRYQTQIKVLMRDWLTDGQE